MATLSMEDAAILALESGPIRGHTVKLLVMDDAPAEPGRTIPTSTSHGTCAQRAARRR